MPFTSNLSELMRERKLTYEELQFRSKVAPDTIARVKDERIATVKLLTLEKLATALEISSSTSGQARQALNGEECWHDKRGPFHTVNGPRFNHRFQSKIINRKL